MTEPAGSPASDTTWRQVSAWVAVVTTRTESASGSTRSTVALSRVTPEASSGIRCLGTPARDSGQSRVPLPPASTRMW